MIFTYCVDAIPVVKTFRIIHPTVELTIAKIHSRRSQVRVQILNYGHIFFYHSVNNSNNSPVLK